MRKILNDEFSVTLTNFTDINDQFSYFVKTLKYLKDYSSLEKNVLFILEIILN